MEDSIKLTPEQQKDFIKNIINYGCIDILDKSDKELSKMHKQMDDEVKKIDELPDVDPCEISEQLCSFISQQKEKSVKLLNKLTNNSIVINLSNSEYIKLLTLLSKFNPTIKKILYDSIEITDMNKEEINKHIEYYVISLLSLIKNVEPEK